MTWLSKVDEYLENVKSGDAHPVGEALAASGKGILAVAYGFEVGAEFATVHAIRATRAISNLVPKGATDQD
jgi:hypothetical protein